MSEEWELNAKALFDAVTAGRTFVAITEIDGQVVGYCNLRSWPAGGWEIVGKMKDEIRKGVNGILMSRIVDDELHPNR